MDALIYFIPQSVNFPPGTVRGIVYGEKTVRIIYYSEDMSFFSFLRFKRRIKNQIKNCKMFQSAMADKFKNEKIYKDGTRLIFSHIKDIIWSVSKENIVVVSADIGDLDTLGDILTQTKKIEILTLPHLVEEYENALLENYGIAGAARAAVRTEGKTVIVMPHGDICHISGADKVIDFSGGGAFSDLKITFIPPKELKKAGTFIKSPDCLETALDFLGIDYSKARLSAVTFTK